VALCRYSMQSCGIIRVIKSRMMRWAKHVARIGATRNAYIFWLESLKGRDRLEDLAFVGCGIKMELESMDWIRLARDRDQWGL
jgi:hypothetical protein